MGIIVKYNTCDGGKVVLENGCIENFYISVTQLDENQEPYTASVHLSNSQGFELAMELLARVEVRV